MDKLLTMSTKELSRLEVVQRLKDKRLILTELVSCTNRLFSPSFAFLSTRIDIGLEKYLRLIRFYCEN